MTMTYCIHIFIHVLALKVLVKLCCARRLNMKERPSTTAFFYRRDASSLVRRLGCEWRG